MHAASRRSVYSGARPRARQRSHRVGAVVDACGQRQSSSSVRWGLRVRARGSPPRLQFSRNHHIGNGGEPTGSGSGRRPSRFWWARRGSAGVCVIVAADAAPLTGPWRAFTGITVLWGVRPCRVDRRGDGWEKERKVCLPSTSWGEAGGPGVGRGRTKERDRGRQQTVVRGGLSAGIGADTPPATGGK